MNKTKIINLSENKSIIFESKIDPKFKEDSIHIKLVEYCGDCQIILKSIYCFSVSFAIKEIRQLIKEY